MSYSARHKRLGPDREAGKHSQADRRHWRIPARKNRADADRPEGPDRDDEDQTGQVSLR